MSTITVPLTPELDLFIEGQLRGEFKSKAELVRQALQFYQEALEVQEILNAQREGKEGKILKGNLRQLAKKFK